LSGKLKLADDDWCFVCGGSNPIGLKLQFATEGDEYVTYFTPSKHHQGYEGIVHGGIVSTVLDEVMARYVYVLGRNAVTAGMTVRLKKPAKVGATIRFAGKIDSENGRLISCSAIATDERGEMIAEATARMLKVA
jgi:acyl-coenzyme A thioesterase PaaI-like protein